MMTFVYIPHQSIRELIEIFKNSNVFSYAQHQENPAPNFVLVDPALYHGSYGGILFRKFVPSGDYCIFEELQNDLCLVWWKNVSLFNGDVKALSYNGRVAVTPKMFNTMQMYKAIRKPAAKSSYYGANKAWRINATSS